VSQTDGDGFGSASSRQSQRDGRSSTGARRNVVAANEFNEGTNSEIRQ
jgi:hypothetical protein